MEGICVKPGHGKELAGHCSCGKSSGWGSFGWSQVYRVRLRQGARGLGRVGVNKGGDPGSGKYPSTRCILRLHSKFMWLNSVQVGSLSLVVCGKCVCVLMYCSGSNMYVWIDCNWIGLNTKWPLSLPLYHHAICSCQMAEAE